VETVENSVEKMQRLLTQLRSGSPSPGGLSIIDLEGLLKRVMVSKQACVPTPQLEVTTGGLQLRADKERLERVVGHLIQNAIEATPADGVVVVRLKLENDSAVVEVEDTGVGMTQEFIRERLFQPFETTKVSGMGIGAYESREYVRELGGRLDVDSEPSKGTTFRVKLPLASSHSATGNMVALQG
jgi:putative PEP-CTERM system histidine kinase